MMNWNWTVFCAAAGWALQLFLLSPVTAAFSLSPAGFGTGIGLLGFRGAVRRAQIRAAGMKKRKRKRKMNFRKEAIRYVLRHTKLEALRFSGAAGFENAMHTALFIGSLQALSASFPGRIDSRVKPDFSGRVRNVEITGILSAPAGHIIWAVLISAAIRIRERIRKWRSIRSKG